MGITGLLPLLRSITRRVHLEQLAGQAVAVDAYSWLHKGVYGACATDLFNSRHNDRSVPRAAPGPRSFVEFCMAKVQLLLRFNVRPILVFDGGHLPTKTLQEEQRARSRRENRTKALDLIAAGNASAAYLHIQKSTDVTPAMAARLIRELRKIKVDYVVAPYEADAQMAWLDQMGHVAAVITEDSDLLLYGCKRVLFKLDRDGWADEICLDRLPQTDALDLTGFSVEKLRHMCMLSGCDYLPSVHGMGLKTAYKYMSKYHDIHRVLRALRAEMGAKMPASYEADFAKAEMTFLHQRVYDLEHRRMVFLTPLPAHADPRSPDDWSFLGKHYPDAIAEGISQGVLCPNTLEPFAKPALHSSQPDVVAIAPPTAAELPATPPPSQLPFEICLDRKQPARPAARLASLALVSRAAQAARLTLKRSFVCDAGGKENRAPPAVRPRNFAFGPVWAHGRPGTGAALSAAAVSPARPPTLTDPKQRSIRDFFRKTTPQ